MIGNGDVTSPYLAKKMIDETGCDAVMIGRGVLGNPWLIKQCIEYLDYGKEPKEVSFEEKVLMMKKHYQLLCEDKNEKVALLEIRSHILWYLKGMPNSKEMKNKIMACKSSEDIFNSLDHYLSNIKELV